MDTQEALNSLQGIKNTLLGEQAGNIAKVDALDVAIGILKGTLETQLTELSETKGKEIESLQTSISEKDTRIAELEALIPKPDPQPDTPQ